MSRAHEITRTEWEYCRNDSEKNNERNNNANEVFGEYGSALMPIIDMINHR